MTTLRLPHEMAAGGEEDVSRAMSNFYVIQTWANGALDDGNMVSGEYRREHPERLLLHASDYRSTLTTSGDHPLGMFRYTNWDPSEHAIVGRTLQLRVGLLMYTNSTAPGVDITVRLNYVTPEQSTLPQQEVGATIADNVFTGVLGNSISYYSEVVTAPQAGLIGFSANASAALAANCRISLTGQLWVGYDLT